MEGPASRRGIGHDLDPNRETTAHSPHGGLDIGLSTPATARIGSNPPEVPLCRPPLSSHSIECGPRSSELSRDRCGREDEEVLPPSRFLRPSL
jgi:hypothetical protein